MSKYFIKFGKTFDESNYTSFLITTEIKRSYKNIVLGSKFRTEQCYDENCRHGYFSFRVKNVGRNYEYSSSGFMFPSNFYLLRRVKKKLNHKICFLIFVRRVLDLCRFVAIPFLKFSFEKESTLQISK